MAKTYSCLLIGLDVVEVEIETVVGSGFSGLSILGLRSEIVRDMRERVRSALESIGIPIPAKRVVVNISPQEILKLSRTSLQELDFAVAASIVLALFADQGLSFPNIDKEFFAGELTLTGRIKCIQNLLIYEKIAHLYESKKNISISCSSEILKKSSMNAFKHYETLSDWLSHRKYACPDKGKTKTKTMKNDSSDEISHPYIENAVAAIKTLLKNPKTCVANLVAAAGWHHLIFIGEPGIGKSFSIQKIQKLLLPPNQKQQIEIQLIHSNALDSYVRPFRSPHHSSTTAALIGGQTLKPGEVTLAHHGVLFLDEIAEFSRQALEALREPLDSEKVELSKASGSMSYPAKFLLCATTNPCPCGYLLSHTIPCRCKPSDSKQYINKLSGPLLDRFCLQVVIENPNRPFHNKKDLFSEYLLSIRDNEQKLFAFVKNFLQVQMDQMSNNEKSDFKKNKNNFNYDLHMQTSLRAQNKISRLINTFHKIFPELSDENNFTDHVLMYRNLSHVMNKELIHL